MRRFFSLFTGRASTATAALILSASAGPALAQETAGASGIALVDDAPFVIRDPHYGEAVFYFNQGRFFTALASLAASQRLQRVRHQPQDAERLRIGLLLSYGMRNEAARALAQLGENGAAPAIRDRAAFHLAQAFYQRGQFADAEKALGRVTQALGPALEEERAVLKANLLMRRQDYAGAAKELEQVRIKQALGPYARFNLGVALVRSGQETRGIALLDEIGKAPATATVTEESAALRDKANVALGVASLLADRPENARAYLERVRLNGMLANMALLQFGWADAALKRPRAALVPWTELSVRTPVDVAVLEAKLAVPWAFAALGEERQASDRYKDAIAIYDQERRDLDASIAAIRGGKLLAGLLERNPGDEMGWFWNIAQLPDMPFRAHVAQVLAEHSLQEALKDYHDLTFLARNLERWKERLGAMERDAGRERIAEAEQRLRAITSRVAALLAEQKRYVEDLAVGALQAQKERLAAYDRQARLAVEQIYEGSRKEPGKAEGPRKPPGR